MAPATMAFGRGDVVLVPFAYTSQGSVEWRPAVVVSSDAYNQGPDVMVASITSNLGALPHPGDHRVQDWRGAGLRLPSLAQTKITTIEASLVGRKLGALGADDMTAFDLGLREALNL
jgi:mRNA-degrading endonuclease toxin of MazEF toxin-antitoxin module